MCSTHLNAPKRYKQGNLIPNDLHLFRKFLARESSVTEGRISSRNPVSKLPEHIKRRGLIVATKEVALERL
jgi:hypothetical protein